MKRFMTYVIAAVFAFCLFCLLPDRVMREANAFSDGNQSVVSADTQVNNFPAAAPDIQSNETGFELMQANYADYADFTDQSGLTDKCAVDRLKQTEPEVLFAYLNEPFIKPTGDSYQIISSGYDPPILNRTRLKPFREPVEATINFFRIPEHFLDL